MRIFQASLDVVCGICLQTPGNQDILRLKRPV